MAILLEGKATAEKVRKRLAEEIKKLPEKPGLAAILVGSNPASRIYVDIKEKTCKEVGIYSERHNLPENTDGKELIALIEGLNAKSSIHGILLQLPLPGHINTQTALDIISPAKDVDGFTSRSVAKLAAGNEDNVPCTPKGIIRLLEEYKIPMASRHAVVVGRSMIVGKPTAAMLLNRNATVTICHSKTPNLGNYTREADILIVAAGKPRLVTAEMVKQGAGVVDVGINKVDGGIAGDVDFESCKDKAGWISPVPGGVGPMTVAMLLENTLNCYKGIEG